MPRCLECNLLSTHCNKELGGDGLEWLPGPIVVCATERTALHQKGLGGASRLQTNWKGFPSPKYSLVKYFGEGGTEWLPSPEVLAGHRWSCQDKSTLRRRSPVIGAFAPLNS